MEDLSIFWLVVTALLFLATTFFLFRYLRARTRKNSIVSGLVILILMVPTILALNLSGLVPTSSERTATSPPVTAPDQMISQLPLATLLLLGLAGAIWIIGGNALIFRQRRKAGLSILASLSPFTPTFGYFDGKTWRHFILLTIVALALGMASFSIPHPIAPADGNAPMTKTERP